MITEENQTNENQPTTQNEETPEQNTSNPANPSMANLNSNYDINKPADNKKIKILSNVSYVHLCDCIKNDWAPR